MKPTGSQIVRHIQASAIEKAYGKTNDGTMLVEVEFEVFGEIQGTFFLKYAREMCEKLGLTGWIKLSRRSTVVGQLQGEKDRVDEMALWLRLQGAPGCRIEHTDFKNWQIIDSLSYKTFNVRF